MDFTIEKRNEVLLVTLRIARLEAAACDRITSLFKGREEVVLDLSSLTRFDGRGLGALLHWLRAAEASSTRLVICGLSKQVRSLFELLGLHKLVEICTSSEDALNAIHGRAETVVVEFARGHAAGER